MHVVTTFLSRLGCSILLAATLLCAAQADAPNQPAFRIMAIVGEDPVSSLDVMERVKLVIGTTGLTPSAETVKKMIPQVLKQLVDETLQAQEAKKRGIVISETELAEAVAMLEQQNGKAPGSLRTYIEGKGLPWRAFLEQTKAQLRWNKLMTSAIRSQVRISENEVERASKNKRYQAGKEELNITPLVLPVDNPDQEADVLGLAQKLASEIRSGAEMEPIVRQLMKLPAEADPSFWISPNQVDPEISQALKKESGLGLIGPIRTPQGYHLIRVNDRRRVETVSGGDPTEVLIKEVLLSLENDATPKEVQLTLELASEIAKNPGSCTEPNVAGYTELEESALAVDFVRAAMRDLPPYARDQVEKLAVSEVGEPFATPQGIRFFMLCERIEFPGAPVDDTKLRETLFRERMELEAAKFMRNLRRETFVEIRG